MAGEENAWKLSVFQPGSDEHYISQIHWPDLENGLIF